ADVQFGQRLGVGIADVAGLARDVDGYRRRDRVERPTRVAVLEVRTSEPDIGARPGAELAVAEARGVVVERVNRLGPVFPRGLRDPLDHVVLGVHRNEALLRIARIGAARILRDRLEVDIDAGNVD